MDGTPERIEVVTDHGNYSADQMVFTCGAWMLKCFAMSGYRCGSSAFRCSGSKRRNRTSLELGRLPIYLWQQSDDEHFYSFPHLS